MVQSISYRRWNKGLAICFAVIAFMALIIVVLQKEITAVRTVPEGDPCDVIIQDVDSSRINDVIDRQVKEELCNTTGIELTLLNVAFPAKKLDLTWVKAPTRIEKLTIESNQLLNIGKKSLKQLTNGFFERLRSFCLSNASIIIRTDSTVFFDSFASTLESLTLHRIYNVKVQKILSQIRLFALTSLDLSYNNLGNQLGKDFFANVPYVQKLVLAHCKIYHLSPDAFFILRSTIQVIDLHANFLKKLPTGFAERFSGRVHILLQENPWDCTCNRTDDIQYLKCLENCEDTLLSENESQHHLAKRSIFQPHNIVKRETNNATIPLQCEDINDSTKTETVTVKAKSYDIRITDKDDKLLVSVIGPINGAYLIWFNDSMTSNKDDDAISRHIECKDLGPMTLNNVEEGTTYTFCVIESGAEQISPFNCAAYYVRPKNSDTVDARSVWISTEQKTSAICFACGTLLGLVWLGAMFGTCMIRKYPHWLEGSKGVIIVDNSHRFDKRGSCAMSSAFSIDDNNAVDYAPYLYSMDNPSKAQDPYEIALKVTHFDAIKPDQGEVLQEVEKQYYDATEKLPQPPLPPVEEADDDPIYATVKDVKKTDGKLSLDFISGDIYTIPDPKEFDHEDKQNLDDEVVYAKCNFDQKVNKVKTDES